MDQRYAREKRLMTMLQENEKEKILQQCKLQMVVCFT
uniref:Uncharacterized protein n=1 Tax=Rhizophora mucronata TaxID=61149 RepID=A0A2P2J3P8_RHIMU